MTARYEAVTCPFCGFAAEEYRVLLHMEEQHAEGESPFISQTRTDTSHSMNLMTGDGYVECPIEGCGEVFLARELDDHLELHAEVNEIDSANALKANVSTEKKPVAEQSQQLPQRKDRRSSISSSISSKQRKAVQAWRRIFSSGSSQSKKGKSKQRDNTVADTPDSATNTPQQASTEQAPMKRLGKAELGKYAHEKAMPPWLVDHLKKNWGIAQPGIVPVLEQLLEQSKTTRYAYLCDPDVIHVSKLRREGGFCGYRNLQTLSSYIISANLPGTEVHFQHRLPSIFQLQDWIEDAWDAGIKAEGRIETGGVRGTRKYIGTPEAQAVLQHLGVPCEAVGFKDKQAGNSETAMLHDVEMYFSQGRFDPAHKVRVTKLPPIYWQHQGHSMTIVGIERTKAGATNLLVFDPMFGDPKAVVKLVDQYFEHYLPDLLLKPYRRGNSYLKKFNEFELLKITPPSESLLP